MTIMTEEFPIKIKQVIEERVKEMDLFWKVIEGAIPPDRLKILVTRYYAEIKTFIDLKLPERMRLCPSNAHHVRKLFNQIYKEEHGDFEEGQDHPTLLRKLCLALGVTDEELETEYQLYVTRFNYMRELETSWENMITELAIMVAWESVTPKFGKLPFQALRKHYSIPEEALDFFKLHEECDACHSSDVMDILVKSANTQALQKHALATIEKTLDLNQYFV